MTGTSNLRRVLAIATCTAVASSGCAFGGLNSLPLPGAVGRGSGAEIYHVEFANIGTLQSNSPVMIDDVVVGSVGKMTFENWHIDVELSVRPDVVVPANVTASIGQTSLLGSMHVALNPPVGQEPSGRLQPGATLALDRSSTSPSTEQTLASLSTVVNGGGLGQIGDIIHNFTAALSGRESDVRDLLTRLDTFVGTFDAQRDNIVASIAALNRLAGTFAGQRDVIEKALQKIPPALDVLIRERPRITTALEKLGVLSNTATQFVNDTQADLVKNLQNLEPAIRSLADVGTDLDLALASVFTYPTSQNLIDRGVRGDYTNSYIIADFTVPRLKRTLFLGTRWGEEGAKLIPAPGEPAYQNYTYDPLTAGATPPPPDTEPDDASSVSDAMPMPPVTEPILPVAPPRTPMVFGVPGSDAPPASNSPTGVFAGPYGPPAPTPTGGG